MDDKLIIIRQLPVIEQRLKELKESNEEKVKAALNMACTEETVKAIKGVRTALNQDFTALEEQRKEVKKKVFEPYEQFEVVYKDCVTDVYRSADATLKSRIDEVENGIKAEKEREVREYFEEYRTSVGLDFPRYEGAQIQVNLSTSLKKLKAQAKEFLDRVAGDLALMVTQEHKEEVLVEYRKSLNASSAILTVKTRHEEMEAEQRRLEQRRQQEQVRQEAVQAVEEAVEAWAPPEEALPPEEETQEEVSTEPKYTLSFQVRGTMRELAALKKFLIEGWYDYE